MSLRRRIYQSLVRLRGVIHRASSNQHDTTNHPPRYNDPDPINHKTRVRPDPDMPDVELIDRVERASKYLKQTAKK